MDCGARRLAPTLPAFVVFFCPCSFGLSLAVPRSRLPYGCMSSVLRERGISLSTGLALELETAPTVVSGNVVYPKSTPGSCFDFMAAQQQTFTRLHFTRRVHQRIV